jgi:hypothetical protein
VHQAPELIAAMPSTAAYPLIAGAAKIVDPLDNSTTRGPRTRLNEVDALVRTCLLKINKRKTNQWLSELALMGLGGLADW